MRVKVLGSAAGGGFPQWNCACPNCSGLRSGAIKARPRTQAQVVVAPNQSAWFLLNASPDLRQQILATPELSVTSVSLASPISTILLTSADVDCVWVCFTFASFSLCTFIRPCLSDVSSPKKTASFASWRDQFLPCGGTRYRLIVSFLSSRPLHPVQRTASSAKPCRCSVVFRTT